MIIGLDTSAVGERSTGTSKYIHCLLNELCRTDHTIRTFSHHNKNHIINDKLGNSLPFNKRGGINRNLYRKYFLSSEMKKESVDCGIFPNYLMPNNFNKPSVIIIHDLSFFSHPHFYSKAFVWYYKNQLRQSLQNNPLIATISEYSKNCINKYLGIPENEIYLLQGYSSTAKNQPNGPTSVSEPKSRYFLCVGHIEPRKNLSFLISSFIEWNRENDLGFKLKLAGEVWSNSKEIHKLICIYKDHPDIEFLGYVIEDELQKLYTGASAFVHASLVEGFGFPVLEAMHYGLPILCSAGSGTEEISSTYSIFFNPTDTLGIKKGFDKLMNNPAERKVNHSIKYSSELMQSQLINLLTAINKKVKG